MNEVENKIIFNKYEFEFETSYYMHIKTENSIYSLFNESYSVVVPRNFGDEEKILTAEIYYLYKDSEFVKSFALKTCINTLVYNKIKKIIGETPLRATTVRFNYNYGFLMSTKGASIVGSIFKNSHLFNRKLSNPFLAYKEAVELFQEPMRVVDKKF